MVILIILPVAVFLLWAIIELREMRKHDLVLYRFCQLRREVMMLLREEHQLFSPDEYRFARRMLQFLNATIGLYSDHKRRLFSWGSLKPLAREYKLSAEQINELAAAQKNEKLSRLLSRAGHATLEGFLAYAPLFRHAILVGFAVWTAKTIGERLRKAQVDRFLALIAVVRQQSDQYGDLRAA